ncbi:uncharacterized protein TRIADDRAFT_18345, partial [Trichoplax adhaerens]
ELVESVPQNLTYPAKAIHLNSTYQAWMKLIKSAQHTIDIASFYWTLQGSDTSFHDNSANEGQSIFHQLLNAGTKRNISIRIVQNEPSKRMKDVDTQELMNKHAAQVRSINFTRLLRAGILHTKFMLVDNRHFLVGSANFDWRALTQIHEVGIMMSNCKTLATDLQKIFQIYWKLSEPNSVIPSSWSPNYDTKINVNHPLNVRLNKDNYQVYLSSSPPQFCPHGRTTDIDSILATIKSAKKSVSIAVMDYSPTTLYAHPNKYWPVIDDALRDAMFNRGVNVKVMGSYWNHTRSNMIRFLKSLASIDGTSKGSMQVKLYRVPVYTEDQRKIPFARVNHNKYMVTDSVAYIGTSNWSGDYFINTGGVGVIIKPQSDHSKKSIRDQLQDVFDRDWSSEHAVDIFKFKSDFV